MTSETANGENVMDALAATTVAAGHDLRRSAERRVVLASTLGTISAGGYVETCMKATWKDVQT